MTCYTLLSLINQKFNIARAVKQPMKHCYVCWQETFKFLTDQWEKSVLRYYNGGVITRISHWSDPTFQMNLQLSSDLLTANCYTCISLTGVYMTKLWTYMYMCMLNFPGKHPVSALQELCARKRWDPPRYDLKQDVGPAHLKLFLYQVHMYICHLLFCSVCQPVCVSITLPLWYYCTIGLIDRTIEYISS